MSSQVEYSLQAIDLGRQHTGASLGALEALEYPQRRVPEWHSASRPRAVPHAPANVSFAKTRLERVSWSVLVETSS